MARKDAQYWIDQQKAAFDEERDRHNAMGSFVAQKGIGIGPTSMPPPPELNPDGTYTKAEIERQKKMKTEVEQQTENSEGDDEGDDGGEEDDEEDDIPDLDELDEDLDPDLDLDPDEEETENAFCPGAGADDNSCPPANKGEGSSGGDAPGPEIELKGSYKTDVITASHEWAKTLTPGEEKAIDYWAGAGSEAIRYQIAEGEEGQVAKDFVSAIEKAPIYEGILYRGMAGGARGKEAMGAILKAGVGGTWEDKAPESMTSKPMSMSRSALIGERWAQEFLLFRVQSKTGRAIEARGHEITNPKKWPEMEVVGLPNKQYRIKAITENPTLKHGGGTDYRGEVQYLVDLEEI